MSYRIIVILLMGTFTFVSSKVEAQDSLATYKKWSIGVKGGASFSSIANSDDEITRARFSRRTAPIQGIVYGGLIRYMTEKNFGLQIEANYVEKGWRERFENINTGDGRLDPDRYYQVNLNYLEVPVLAYGYFGKRNLQLFLTLGMYGGFLLSHSTETAPTVDPNEITFEYLAPEQNTHDLGARGGAGAAVVTRIGTFQVEATYSLGFNSVMDRNRATIPSVLQNNAIVGSFGYLVQF